MFWLSSVYFQSSCVYFTSQVAIYYNGRYDKILTDVDTSSGITGLWGGGGGGNVLNVDLCRLSLKIFLLTCTWASNSSGFVGCPHILSDNTCSGTYSGTCSGTCSGTFSARFC